MCLKIVLLLTHILMEDDQILAVNNYSLNNNLDKWLNYFNDDDIILKISRKG